MADNIQDFVNRDRLSVCCGAPMIRDSDICSECKEHSAEICETCEGFGEVVNRKRISCRTVDVPYIKCPDCGGSGVTEN